MVVRGHVHSGGACVVGSARWEGGMGGRGACVAGGMNGGIMHGGRHAWQERWPLQQTVRILLGCIFVVSNDYMKVE